MVVYQWHWGDISGDVTSTCSDWALMVSGATGRNDISMLSPFLTLCSTWWYSTVNSLVANKGCCNQTFCLVVLIRIIGTALAFVLAKHLFTMMPRGRLWCSACSSRHVTFDGILSVCPRMVITESLGCKQDFSKIQLWPVLFVQFCHQNIVGLF